MTELFPEPALPKMTTFFARSWGYNFISVTVLGSELV